MPIDILTHNSRHTYPVAWSPLCRHRARQLHSALLVADDGLITVLSDNVLICAGHKVLMSRQIGRQQPLLAKIIFAIHLAVEGVDLATRARHHLHIAITYVTTIVVRQPSVHISRIGRHLPIATQVVPREDATKCMLALAILEIGVATIVGGEHLQLTIGISVPRLKAELIALPRIIIGLLQDVQILERSAAITLYGVVLADDIFILIVDIQLLVVVTILIIVGRR